MEKIKLKDKKVFDIVPMGINTDKFNKKRKFSFITDKTIEEIETDFKNVDSISKIEYLSNADELLKEYTDCKQLKSISKEFNKEVENGIFSDVISIELEIQ